MQETNKSNHQQPTRRDFARLLAAGAGIAATGKAVAAAPEHAATSHEEVEASSVVEMKEFAFPEGRVLAMRIDGALNETMGYLVRCPKGTIVCMNFNVDFLASKGKTVAQMSDIPGLDRIMDAVIKKVPDAAAKLGVRPAMTVKEAVLKLM